MLMTMSTFYYYTDVKDALGYTGNYAKNLSKFLMWIEGVDKIKNVDFINNFQIYGTNNGESDDIPTKYRCNAEGYMLECNHKKDYTHITHCICGCAIQHVNYFIHKSLKRFYIGSECVKNFTEERGKGTKRETTREAGEILGKKYCFVCVDDEGKKLKALEMGVYCHKKCVNKKNKKYVENKIKEIKKQEDTKKIIRYEKHPDDMDIIEWGEDYVGKTYKYVIDNDPWFAYMVYYEYIETNVYIWWEFTRIEKLKIKHFRAYYHFNILTKI